MTAIDIPDLIKSVAEAAKDTLPDTTKQTDGALSALVGFFNNVVLYPVKKANLTFRYKLEAFEDDLKEKIQHIPQENLQAPPTMIAGPALEALRYTYDEEELREMYENLLASSMDNRIAGEAHPSFVDAIKQMSPLDARVLSAVVAKTQYRCGKIKFLIKNTTQIYSKAMPDHFVVELCDLADPFAISSSLINLERLGLVEITEGGLKSGGYETMRTHPFVQQRIKIFEQFGKEFEVKVSEHAVVLNNYGTQFAKICMAKEKLSNAN